MRAPTLDAAKPLWCRTLLAAIIRWRGYRCWCCWLPRRLQRNSSRRWFMVFVVVLLCSFFVVGVALLVPVLPHALQPVEIPREFDSCGARSIGLRQCRAAIGPFYSSLGIGRSPSDLAAMGILRNFTLHHGAYHHSGGIDGRAYDHDHADGTRGTRGRRRRVGVVLFSGGAEDSPSLYLPSHEHVSHAFADDSRDASLSALLPRRRGHSAVGSPTKEARDGLIEAAGRSGHSKSINTTVAHQQQQQQHGANGVASPFSFSTSFSAAQQMRRNVRIAEQNQRRYYARYSARVGSMRGQLMGLRGALAAALGAGGGDDGVGSTPSSASSATFIASSSFHKDVMEEIDDAIYFDGVPSFMREEDWTVAAVTATPRRDVAARGVGGGALAFTDGGVSHREGLEPLSSLLLNQQSSFGSNVNNDPTCLNFVVPPPPLPPRNVGDAEDGDGGVQADVNAAVSVVVDYSLILPHIFPRRAWAHWHALIGHGKTGRFTLKGSSRPQSFGGRGDSTRRMGSSGEALRGGGHYLYVDAWGPGATEALPTRSVDPRAAEREGRIWRWGRRLWRGLTWPFQGSWPMRKHYAFGSDGTARIGYRSDAGAHRRYALAARPPPPIYSHAPLGPAVAADASHRRRQRSIYLSLRHDTDLHGPPPALLLRSSSHEASFSSSSSDALPLEYHHSCVIKLAAAFSIYDANPRSDSVIPAYAVTCVGVDCAYIGRHIDRVYEFGVGYFAWFINSDSDEGARSLGRFLAVAFPTRFIMMTSAVRLGAAGTWNRFISTFFKDTSSPLPWCIIANGDFFPHENALEDFLRFMHQTMRGGAGEGSDGEGGTTANSPPFNPNHTIIKFQHYSFFAYTYRAFMVLGAFDESVYPAYGEDVEMVYRARSLGLTFDDYSATEDQYVHVGSISRKDPLVARERYFWARLQYIYQKWNINLHATADWEKADFGPLRKHPWGIPSIPHRSSFATDPRHLQCIRRGGVGATYPPMRGEFIRRCFWNGSFVKALMPLLDDGGTEGLPSGFTSLERWENVPF